MIPPYGQDVAPFSRRLTCPSLPPCCKNKQKGPERRLKSLLSENTSVFRNSGMAFSSSNVLTSGSFGRQGQLVYAEVLEGYDLCVKFV